MHISIFTYRKYKERENIFMQNKNNEYINKLYPYHINTKTIRKYGCAI